MEALAESEHVMDEDLAVSDFCDKCGEWCNDLCFCVCGLELCEECFFAHAPMGKPKCQSEKT